MFTPPACPGPVVRGVLPRAFPGLVHGAPSHWISRAYSLTRSIRTPCGGRATRGRLSLRQKDEPAQRP